MIVCVVGGWVAAQTAAVAADCEAGGRQTMSTLCTFTMDMDAHTRMNLLAGESASRFVTDGWCCCVERQRCQTAAASSFDRRDIWCAICVQCGAVPVRSHH